jgi:hypothetical protein
MVTSCATREPTSERTAFGRAPISLDMRQWNRVLTSTLINGNMRTEPLIPCAFSIGSGSLGYLRSSLAASRTTMAPSRRSPVGRRRKAAHATVSSGRARHTWYRVSRYPWRNPATWCINDTRFATPIVGTSLPSEPSSHFAGLPVEIHILLRVVKPVHEIGGLLRVSGLPQLGTYLRLRHPRF